MELGVFHSSGREDSVENNESTVDSTIIKLLKGVNREDLKEKLVQGFTVEKLGDIIEREREPRVLTMLAWSLRTQN